jgi:hypothetical protein
MLLLSIALLAVQQTSTEPVQEEIVVIGQRLKHWTGTYQIRGSRMRCATKTSTGDREVDAIGCQAFVTCADSLAPRITASDDRSLSKDERLRMKDSIKRDLSVCVLDTRSELVAALAGRRAKVR